MSANWNTGDVAMVECGDGGWRRATYRDYPGQARGAEWVFTDGLIRRAADSIARGLLTTERWDHEAATRGETQSGRDRRLISLGFDAGWDAHAAYIEGGDRCARRRGGRGSASAAPCRTLGSLQSWPRSSCSCSCT